MVFPIYRYQTSIPVVVLQYHLFPTLFNFTINITNEPLYHRMNEGLSSISGLSFKQDASQDERELTTNTPK